MAEHPDPDLVLDLALGHLSGPERDEVLTHVADCTSCQNDLDGLTTAVEASLAAVPRTDPPAGFATRVLQRLEDESPSRTDNAPERHHSARRSLAGPAVTPERSHRTPAWIGIAAAAVLGLGAGAGLTAALIERPDGAPATEQPVASQGSPLLTADGDTVGFVSRSWSEGDPVLVVDVSGGDPGRSYLCRLGLDDGGTEDVGRWSLSGDRPNSWVVPDPGATTVELVSDSGATWSTATL
ncbi:hypothetical protein NF556_19965 [Ornithinimicrobium faecis]|uniref:Zinc finger protein n=1 Tax=Ornithinimicrobium faecis TaxID=2934158 RepID=A0ABY4YU86_9MICO|nr:hypothetical protein [Ornithinimicrobium sp. HY1793]USQ79835.1 hypothetical protein NF556_19965 [Ornithinimicrobium sp. HY1793]